MNDTAEAKVLEATPKYAWIILLVVFLAGFTAPANMAKVMVLAPVLMQAFGIDTTLIGLAIGGFYLLGFLLAFPAAGIVNKFGVKVTIGVAVACGLIGSLISVLSAGIPMFMIGRVLEGAAMGIMGVAGPSAITPWFPRHRRGLALGVWAAWVAVAMTICPALYAKIGATSPWQNVWWITVVLDAVVLVLFLLLYKKPTVVFHGEEIDIAAPNKSSEVFKNSNIWFLAAIFLFAELAFMSINGFLTTYLTSVVAAPLETSGLVVSWFALTGAIMAVVVGALSDKLGTRKWVLVATLVFGVAYTAIVFNTTSLPWYWVIGIIGGITGGGTPGMLWSSAPELVKHDQVPTAVAFLACSQNIGMFAGAVMLGGVISALGWSMSSWVVLVPAYVICLIFALLCRKLR